MIIKDLAFDGQPSTLGLAIAPKLVEIPLLCEGRMNTGSAVKMQLDPSSSVPTPRSGTDSRPSNLPTIRTTIVIPTTLDKNLEVLRIKMNLTKSELIATALSNFIRANDLEPDKTPSISVSYDEQPLK